MSIDVTAVTGTFGPGDVDRLPVGVVHIDEHAVIRRANRMAGELVGIDAARLLGTPLLAYGVGDPARYAELLDFGTGYRSGVMGPIAVRYRRADGTVRSSAVWSTNHLDDPEVGAIVLVFVPEDARRAVTDAVESVAEWSSMETTLALLSDALSCHPFDSAGCWLIDDAGEQRVEGGGSLGRDVRLALAEDGPWWEAVDADGLVVCDDTAAAGQGSLATAGVEAWWAVPFRHPALGELTAALLVTRTHPGPISPNQREHLEQLVRIAGLAVERTDTAGQLAHAAAHDPLTGARNRGHLRDRAESRPESGSAVLFLDLDHFKSVNDAHGHAAGDAVLVTVVDRIRAVVRPSDTVTRMGGDEFVIECGDIASDADVSAIAERVLTSIAEPIELADGATTVTASLGLARTDGDASVDDLVARADAALLEAKAAGRSSWTIARTDGTVVSPTSD